MIIFASDFDRTLYFYYREPQITKEDIQAIRSFRNEGNLFGICTGRVYEDMISKIRDFIDVDFVISSSGAQILDGDGKTIHMSALDWELANELVEYGERLGCLCLVHMDSQPFGYRNDFYVNCHRLQFMAECKGRDITGVSFRLPPELAERITKVNDDLLAHFKGSINSFSNVNTIDIVAAGVSKGTGINFCKSYFHADTSCAIGDSLNDLPMLKAADLAFTFENASPLVKAIADVIVKNEAEALDSCR